MPSGSFSLLISLVLLVICSGFFSATETAYSCANHIKLKTLFTGGNKIAGKVLKLTEEKFDKLITTILVGNNIVNLSAATISTLFFAKILANIKYIDSSFVSTAAITIAILIFGEITPKFLAKTFPERLAILFYPIITFFIIILTPLTFIFRGINFLISVIFKKSDKDVITEDEIITIVEEAEEDGTLKQEESKLIRSVIEFDDLEVENILTPRVNIVAIEKDMPNDEIQAIFQKSGYSRLPVYKDNIDSIIGTIHQSDFYNMIFNKNQTLKDITKEAIFTTSHTKISKLLKQLQKLKIHMAIVLDEYGGTLGIVTMEDILEELVGEIWDEHDKVVEFINQVNENTYIINGNAPLELAFETLNLLDKRDDFEANTVSGWVLEKLGEIPPSGKTFEYESFKITVLKTTNLKVNQIKIEALTA